MVQKLSWSDIPGYTKLIEIFTEEVETKNLSNFQNLFQETGKILIRIPPNLHYFVQALINRTNLEDSNEVTICI